MYGIIFAFLITVIMFAITIVRAQFSGIHAVYCKKSDVGKVLEDIPDDCMIQILIGGKDYDYKHAGNP